MAHCIWGQLSGLPCLRDYGKEKREKERER